MNKLFVVLALIFSLPVVAQTSLPSPIAGPPYEAAGVGSYLNSAKAAKWSIISSKSNNGGAGTANQGFGYSQNQVTFFHNEIIPSGINPSAIRLCYDNWYDGNFNSGSGVNGENPNLNNLELFGTVYPNTTLNVANPIQPTQNRKPVLWSGGQPTFNLQPAAVQCSDPIYGPWAAGSSYYVATGINANSAPGPAAVTLSTTSTGGTFSNGTYTVSVTYVQTDGSNSTATATNITLSAGTTTQTISLTTPAAAASAIGWRVYEGSTTLQCDQGFGVLPFTASGIGVVPQIASADCVNGNASFVNIPTGMGVGGTQQAGASNNGEGFKAGIQVNYPFYVGAQYNGNSYGPAYILGNVPAVSICAAGDSIGLGLHDDAMGTGGEGFVYRAAINQPSVRYFQTGITPNWGFVSVGRYSETTQTFNSYFGQRRFNICSLASTVNHDYGINDTTGNIALLTNLIQVNQNFLAAGVSSVIEDTLVPHLSSTSDGWQTLAGQSFNFPGAESGRRQLNNVLRGTVCNGTAITGEVPFANKANGAYAYNTNWYAGGDGATASFNTACPINESGTTTVLVNGTSAPFTYVGAGNINGSSATYAQGVTLTSTPANGATVTISYTPSVSMATFVATSTNPLVSGGYFHVLDNAALIEYGPGGSLTLNGGLWGPAGAAVTGLTGLTVTSAGTTFLTNTGGWANVTSVDQYRGYSVVITADSTATGAVGQTAEIVNNGTTFFTVGGFTPLNGGSAVTPDANAVFSVLQSTDTLDGTHPLGRPSQVEAAALIASGWVR